jgi:hypothetical protein
LDSSADEPVVIFNKKCFCAVQWEGSSIVSVIPQSSIFKSPEFTHVNDVCFVGEKRNYRKGKILFKG